MRRLTVAEVHAKTALELGLDPDALDLTSVEAIAGALRRVASFLCPCTAPTLVRSVIGPLRGLVKDVVTIKGVVEDTLGAMIAHGDFLEYHDIGSDSAHRAGEFLYTAPAGFICRESGAVILLGIASDQLSALPQDLEKRIEYVNHVRRLSPVSGEDLGIDLAELGLIERSYRDWLKAPQVETAADHRARLDSILDSTPPSRDVSGLLLLDPERPVRYYRGRWVQPRSQSGRFVARRSQAYGSQLWCYVQLREGNPERLVDLPLPGSRWRGADEAWLLQMAIDAQRGNPQRFGTRPGPTDMHVVFQLFSPVPMWAQRRWDAIGEPVLSSGCLFAYRFVRSELAEELRFARDALWLGDVAADSEPGGAET